MSRTASPPPSRMVRSTSSSSNASSSSSSWPPARRTRSPSSSPRLTDAFNLPQYLMLPSRKLSPSPVGRKRKTSRDTRSRTPENEQEEFAVREGEDVDRHMSLDDTDEDRSVRRRSLSLSAADDEYEFGSGSEDVSMSDNDEDVTSGDVDYTPAVPNNSPTTPTMAIPGSPKLTDAPTALLAEEDLPTSPSPAALPTPPFTHRAHSEPLPATPHSQTAIPEQHNGTFPLGQPLLRIAFCTEEGEDDVPPCFYPGQTIPTTLMFELPRYTSLPHALRPVLTMSLVGTLRFTDEDATRDGEEVVRERSLINVGVSLAEGLRLWGKDAGLAWDKLSERKKRGRQDPSKGLPGGKYTLPLTVQVPTHPKLPPTFALPSKSFEIVYHLEVHLTIDNPIQSLLLDSAADRERTTLIRADRQFTLLPVTLPSVKPDLPSLEGLIQVAASKQEVSSSGPGSVAGPHGWMDRLNSALGPIRAGLHSGAGEHTDTSRFSIIGGALMGVAAAVATSAPVSPPLSWTIVPSLPTSTYSPSSNIPLDLTLLPPPSSDSTAHPTGELVIRATLLRREHIFHSDSVPTPVDEERGLVAEEEIISSCGRFDLASLTVDSDGKIQLPRLNLPLGYGVRSKPWTQGFTTSLTISPEASAPIPTTPTSPIHTHCSSRFYLSLHLAFCPIPTSHTPASNTFSAPASSHATMEIPRQLKPRLLLIPLTVGSVGEPAGARHRRGWRELYLERTNDDGTGEERGRMVSGVACDEEGSWLVAPPSYEVALLEEAYVV